MNASQPTDKLIIVGASTRAAAFSATRVGLSPVCADLFADLDLAEWCKVTEVSGTEYPHGLEQVQRQLPPGPWVYVGALENYPELVGRIAQRRPLWGNGPEVLRRVRDPFIVAACLARAGLPHPRVLRAADSPAPGERWLVKPVAGSGGRGVREYSLRQNVRESSALGSRYSVLSTQYSESDTQSSIPLGHYLQQRIDGLACAAIFVADGARAVLVGLTQQLVGEPELHVKPFHYCGSMGPLPIDQKTLADLSRLGQVLAAEFGLVGLFGVDGILVGGEFWPVEINPRYTASIEVLELGLGLPTIALHRDACAHGTLPTESSAIGCHPSRPAGEMVGKAILFARDSVVVPDLSGWLREPLDCTGRWPIPRIADVPRAGAHFRVGQPICTVFARGRSVEACRDALIDAARDVYGQLTSEAASSRIAACQSTVKHSS